MPIVVSGKKFGIGEGGNTLLSPTNMTSNTTPEPYVITASGEYSFGTPEPEDDFYAWHAFSEDAPRNWLHRTENVAWIQIDLGQEYYVSQIDITPYGPNSGYNVRRATVLGSIDGNNFETLGQLGYDGWYVLDGTYDLSSPDSYRYVRINCDRVTDYGAGFSMLKIYGG